MTGTFTLFGKLPTELRLKIWEFAIPGPRIIRLDLVECEDNTAHTAVEDEEHNGLNVSGSLEEEGTTTAENADTYTLEEGIEQSPIGNTTVDDNMSRSEDSDEATSASDTELEEEKATTFRAHCPPPSLLSICHESRVIASKYYQKTFATPHAPARTYFDFDRDTIYVRYDEFLPYCYDYEEFLHEIAKVRKGGLMMVKKAAVLVDVSEEDPNEWLVANLLGEVFPRLENLTIVLEDVERYSGDGSPTRFIDLIDYNFTIDTYENFDKDVDDFDGDIDDLEEWPMQWADWMDSVEIDPESLERTILRRERRASDLPPLIPAIDFKVAASSYQAEYLEHLRANAEEILKSRAEAG